jgi:hypothetical protein
MRTSNECGVAKNSNNMRFQLEQLDKEELVDLLVYRYYPNVQDEPAGMTQREFVRIVYKTIEKWLRFAIAKNAPRSCMNIIGDLQRIYEVYSK